ncbi:MAG TPA: WYL domain-containing protein [Actinomycetes bacterium]|nr:WYL domain-containing protein [Actinomycetes bacterium]
MVDPTSRLLSLLSLLQTPRLWSGAELAGRLGVTRRTVRRDVDRLRQLGYLVEAVQGRAGGYRLAAGTSVPPLQFQDDEALAIAIGLRMAAGMAMAEFDDASVRALTKVQQVLPSRLRRRVRSLSMAMMAWPSGYGPRVDADVLTMVGVAAAHHERVRLRYAGRDGRIQPRHIEPVQLVAAGRRWYLVAFDLDRADWRTFRVDRITSPAPTGARATHRDPPGGDVADYLEQARSQLAPTFRADVSLDLPLPRARTLLADLLTDSTLTAEGEDRCRWVSHSDTLDWLTLAILRLGCDVDVHGPPELIEHLRAVTGRLGRSLASTAGSEPTRSR